MATSTARRPSPADMSTPRRPTPADIVTADRRLVAPHIRSESEPPFRLLYERGIRTSRMHRHTRLVALTLATHADWVTGVIPEDQQPFLRGLAAETQLLNAQVATALTTLLQRGWVRRSLKQRSEKYETARLQLSVPHLIMARLLQQP